jgi:hypothetical protein
MERDFVAGFGHRMQVAAVCQRVSWDVQMAHTAASADRSRRNFPGQPPPALIDTHSPP